MFMTVAAGKIAVVGDDQGQVPDLHVGMGRGGPCPAPISGVDQCRAVRTDTPMGGLSFACEGPGQIIQSLLSPLLGLSRRHGFDRGLQFLETLLDIRSDSDDSASCHGLVPFLMILLNSGSSR